jgi:hypothetical protein
MPNDVPRQGQDDEMQSLKASVEDGFQKRLRRLWKPFRGTSQTLHDESVLQMLVESAADATEDDELAIQALQELMHDKGLEPRPHDVLQSELLAVRGISNAP